MSEREHAPWTAYERDALNDVLRELQAGQRRLEIDNAIIKTKVGFMSAAFGLAASAIFEAAKLLLHH